MDYNELELNDLEKYILLQRLGMIRCLKEDIVTNFDSQIIMQSLSLIKYLNEVKASEEIIAIVEECLELEGVKRIVPNHYESALNKIETNIIDELGKRKITL